MRIIITLLFYLTFTNNGAEKSWQLLIQHHVCFTSHQVNIDFLPSHVKSCLQALFRESSVAENGSKASNFSLISLRCIILHLYCFYNILKQGILRADQKSLMLCSQRPRSFLGHRRHLAILC